ncbi:MAG TPA: hypothetical protein VJ770_20935 [Stellaceae bacterium]|nr:hypothetical protein [Stellaceae bacterium]
MRSLWRLMARQWLGGESSERLTGDSVLADLLAPERTVPEFCVARNEGGGAPAPAPVRAPETGEHEDAEADTNPCT